MCLIPQLYIYIWRHLYYVEIERIIDLCRLFIQTARFNIKKDALYISFKPVGEMKEAIEWRGDRVGEG